MSESPACDPQREQVYAMESEEFGRHVYHRATRKQLRRWLRELVAEEKVAVPKLKFADCGQYGGTYDHDTGTITLARRGGPCLLILIHEFSHHVEHLKRPGLPDHGPHFCRTYMHLLDVMRLVPSEGFRAAAKRHGVKIARRST